MPNRWRCASHETHCRKANVTQWVSQNDDSDNRRHIKRLKIKSDFRGRNRTGVPRGMKLVPILLRHSDTVGVVEASCMKESFAF